MLPCPVSDQACCDRNRILCWWFSVWVCQGSFRSIVPSFCFPLHNFVFVYTFVIFSVNGVRLVTWNHLHRNKQLLVQLRLFCSFTFSEAVASQVITSCSLFWCCNFSGNPLTLRGCPYWRGWLKMEMLWKRRWTSSSESLFKEPASLLGCYVLWGAVCEPSLALLAEGRYQEKAAISAVPPAVQGGRISAQQVSVWLVLNGANETLGSASPALSCSVPSLVSPVLWSTQHGLVWGLCLEWPGNNRVVSIVSSSLWLTTPSAALESFDFSAAGKVCGKCLLSSQPYLSPSHALARPPHICGSFCSGLILLCVVDFWSSKYICQLYAI